LRLTVFYYNLFILVHQRSNGSRCWGFENQSLPRTHNQNGSRYCIFFFNTNCANRGRVLVRSSRFAVCGNCIRRRYLHYLRRIIACHPLVSFFEIHLDDAMLLSQQQPFIDTSRLCTCARSRAQQGGQAASLRFFAGRGTSRPSADPARGASREITFSIFLSL